MTSSRLLLWPVAAALASVALAAPASAQMQGPTRDYSGVFGGAQSSASESRHQLTLDFTLVGGYDDDVSGATTNVPGDPRFQESSSLGEGTANLSYRYGRQRRYLRLGANGSATTYSALDYDVQASGGGSAEVFSQLGRNATVRALHQTSYRNYFVVGSFTGLGPVFQPDIIPGTTTPFALGRQRAWSNDSTAELTQHWNRSHETGIRGGWHRMDPTEGELGGLNTLEGQLHHSVSVARNTSISANYGYSVADYEREDGSTRDVTSQNAELGLRAERRISPRRQMLLEFGVGGSSIDTVNELTREPVNYWTASGHASAGIDIGRSWGLRGSYRRGWDFQDGFVEPVLTDSVAVSVGGFLGRRVDVVFAGGYGTGQVGFSEGDGYESYTGSGQMRVGLTRNAALFASYVYYFYSFDNTANLAVGIPPEFDRQSVRVGVSFWVPLAGIFQRSGELR